MIQMEEKDLQDLLVRAQKKTLESIGLTSKQEIDDLKEALTVGRIFREVRGDAWDFTRKIFVRLIIIGLLMLLGVSGLKIHALIGE